MFTVTENAARQILASAGPQEGGKVPALRLAAERSPDGTIAYLMGFDEIGKQDLHFESNGIDVIFEFGYKELLQGTTLDWVEVEEGQYGFVFFNPNDSRCEPPENNSGCGGCGGGCA